MKTARLARALVAWGAFALASAVLPAAGETVRIQTGEHARFTRIAMVFEAPTDWTAGRREDGFGLRLSRSDITLDLEGAFRLIPRDRIAGLRWNSDARTLEILSSCDCHLNVFEMPGNTLVVDVRSGPAPAGARFEAQLPPPAGPAADQATRAAAAPEPQPENSLAALPLLQTLSRPQIPLGLTPHQDRAADTVTGTTQQDLVGMEQTLLRSLGAAASEGLVDMTLGDDPALALTPDAPSALAATRHIRSRTASTSPQTPQERAMLDLLRACPDPATIDVAGWGHGTAAQTLAVSHAGLFDDLGRIDPVAALRAARAYIYLGFGQEAHGYLSLLDTRSVETELLRDLADIVDERPDRDPRILGRTSACPSPAALWGLLALPVPSDDVAVDARAVQRAFHQLPPHLQRHLGVHTVRALRKVAKPEAAAAILATLRRMPAGSVPGLATLIGEDRLASGDTAAGEAALGAEIMSSSETSPQALLTLLRAREAREATVPEDLLLLAEGLAQEHRGTPTGHALLDATARAHARDGRFETGFAALADLADLPARQRADLRSDLTTKLASSAPDNLLLIIAFSEGLMLPQADLSDAAARALSARLLDLGFAVEADALLAAITSPDAQTRVLRARAALARGYPQAAMDHLDGLETDAAAALRAQASAAQGQDDVAATLYGEIGAESEASAAAWRSAQDEALARFGSPEEQAFIRSLTGDDSLPLPERAQRAVDDLSQDNLQALLDGSTTFREAAQALLGREPDGNQ